MGPAQSDEKIKMSLDAALKKAIADAVKAVISLKGTKHQGVQTKIANYENILGELDGDSSFSSVNQLSADIEGIKSQIANLKDRVCVMVKKIKLVRGL